MLKIPLDMGRSFYIFGRAPYTFHEGSLFLLGAMKGFYKYLTWHYE
jgi:hypothetical protein